jgi:hypothetical protein
LFSVTWQDEERYAVVDDDWTTPKIQDLLIESDLVCAECGIELSDLSRRGSRHPARAAMAYLPRRDTAVTNGELVEVFGVSRAESVRNLTRRFGE